MATPRVDKPPSLKERGATLRTHLMTLLKGPRTASHRVALATCVAEWLHWRGECHQGRRMAAPMGGECHQCTQSVHQYQPRLPGASRRDGWRVPPGSANAAPTIPTWRMPSVEPIGATDRPPRFKKDLIHEFCHTNHQYTLPTYGGKHGVANAPRGAEWRH
jgi:hypothetical protein